MRIETKEYIFHHSIDEMADEKNYMLHNHYDSYEIFMFLEGDAEYVVEGAVYPLQKYDIILLNPNEFHHIRHLSACRYERVVFEINNHFFTNNSCDEYRQMFDSRTLGTQNMIPASFVVENGVMEIIQRAEKYSYEKYYDILINCTILELLNVLNKYHPTNELSSSNTKITQIIMYINENLTTPLTLDSISQRFYMNKHHLCRVFKKYTGLTINKYITNKRITLVKNLYREGKSLSAAAIEAGFGNYSNFYKMYLNETGLSPRVGMKKG